MVEMCIRDRLIISQYGGPDGELSASMRYLAQRYSMPVKEVGGLLTDIGTEELAHMEIICAMVYQLTKNLSVEEAKTAGFDAVSYTHLDADKANDGTTDGIFMLSEYLLADGVSFNETDSNTYQGSDAQTWCSNLSLIHIYRRRAEM